MKKVENLDAMVRFLKTMTKTNHLRILALLYHEDLTTSDLSFILGQSQSHVLQYLHLLCEACLITSYQKGAENYFKFCHNCWRKDIMMAVIGALPEHEVILAHDLERLLDVKKQCKRMRREFFLRNAVQWEAFRLSSIADHVVDSALLKIIGDNPFETMLSIGINTASVLELFSGLYRRSIEITLESDVLQLSVGEETFDLILLHWALHFLKNPERVLHEVARVLRPQGRLLIVDFIAHDVDSLHVCYADMQRGFLGLQMELWLKNAGLVLEQKRCFTSMQNENNEGFMVAVWLARDPRVLVDDIKDKKVDFA
ncbi:ArsR/SmtB family transcription factor [Bartonella florencae]|uniref:ArsR/SmtB family transcription factor n=1 Tax=Bartonella florencae TaxID=928210 RepID=UPI00030C7087|nr:methyltransferase domain-containing protein [Bartonella florencae]